MDQEKLRRTVEAQSAKDHTALRHWSSRRKQRYDQLMDEPLLPRFCKLCFLSMVLATFVMAFHDVFVFLAYHSYDLAKMLRNVSISAFFTWLLFAAMLIPGAAVQLHRGFDDRYFERFAGPKKNGRPYTPPKTLFLRYLAVSCAGLLVFGAFALLY
ncbi:MAG: hypothetical protein VB055_04030 [Oscillospiraceae bacterium]|nr:hypothetical protein [Oscillospiraceae bacterium]